MELTIETLDEMASVLVASGFFELDEVITLKDLALRGLEAQWRPIEEAYKNPNEWVEMYIPGAGPIPFVQGPPSRYSCYKPTHYRPLPQPPEVEP